MKKKPRNSKHYFSLPYNRNLRNQARELRKSNNLSEVLFWNRVKKRQFLGLDFDRQKIIGNYIVDFYCSNAKTVIEIDGDSHLGKQDYDIKRDDYLKNLGLTVIHIDVVVIFNALDTVIEDLKDHPAFKNFKGDG